jgi:hypothetical protein
VQCEHRAHAHETNRHTVTCETNRHTVTHVTTHTGTRAHLSKTGPHVQGSLVAGAPIVAGEARLARLYPHTPTHCPGTPIPERRHISKCSAQRGRAQAVTTAKLAAQQACTQRPEGLDIHIHTHVLVHVHIHVNIPIHIIHVHLHAEPGRAWSAGKWARENLTRNRHTKPSPPMKKEVKPPPSRAME